MFCKRWKLQVKHPAKQRKGSEVSRVLIIDDSDLVRDFLSDTLSEAGYEVIEAENGAKGLEAFESRQPDCVLLDVVMPDIDGLEVLRRIRERSNELPVFVMTGDDPGWAKRTCSRYGATGFLSKMFDSDIVVETVENAILEAES